MLFTFVNFLQHKPILGDKNGKAYASRLNFDVLITTLNLVYLCTILRSVAGGKTFLKKIQI